MREFPNLKAASGSYEFLTQTIKIANYDVKHFQEWKANKATIYTDISFREFYKTLIHEVNHFLDHTTTLWGLSLILKQANCFDVFTNGSIEKNGKTIRNFMDEMNLINYPDFYKVEYPSDPSLRPWRYNYSMGRLYSKDGNISETPILFTNFFNRDNSKIARCPFSISSILECTSVAPELIVESYFVNSLKDDPVASAIELKNMDKFYNENFLYNRDATLYTTAAHHLANSLKTKDINSTLGCSFYLSKLALNFPSSLFEKIKIPSELESFKQYPQIMLDNKNRAFLFYLFAKAISLKDFKSVVDPKAIIEILCNEINITFDEIETEWKKEYKSLLLEISKTDSNKNFEFIKFSQNNIDTLGMLHDLTINLEKLDMSSIQISGKWFDYKDQVYSKSLDKRYEDIFQLVMRIDEFLEACIM